MTDHFELISNRYGLSEKAVSVLKTVFTEVCVQRGQTVLDFNQLNRHVYIVARGLVKSYFLREGRERILNFAFDGEIAVLPSERRECSSLSVVAIEDSILFKADKRKLEECFRQSVELAYWGYEMIKQVVQFSIDDYMDFLWMDKQEIYKKLLNEHPDILQRIPLQDIAAYLNITPSSLSRIRANIK